MKTVHFVRHGETEQNKDGIWQGHTNTQLSKIGKAQAKLLSDRLNLKNQTVFTSDLARAKETAYCFTNGKRKFKRNKCWRLYRKVCKKNILKQFRHIRCLTR